MKVLVCGDRNWSSWVMVKRRLASLPSDTIVIHGAARGADTIGGEVAKSLGMPVDVYPAQWDKHGRAAGPIRNRQMLDQKPDIVIAFHNNIEESKGTKDCLAEAARRGIATELISDQEWRKNP